MQLTSSSTFHETFLNTSQVSLCVLKGAVSRHVGCESAFLSQVQFEWWGNSSRILAILRKRNITTDAIAIEISFVFFMSLDSIDVQNKCLSVMCVCVCVCVCVCNLIDLLSPYPGNVLTDTTDGRLTLELCCWRKEAWVLKWKQCLDTEQNS